MKKSTKTISIIMTAVLFISFAFCGCVNIESDNEEVNAIPQTSTTQIETRETTSELETTNKTTTTKKSSNRANEILNSMSLKEKVGQLFIVRPEAFVCGYSPEQVNDSNKYGTKTWNSKMTAMLKKYPVGGICVFGKNIKSQSQLKKLVNSMQYASKTKLFMSIDEEGGAVSRIASSSGFNVKKYSSMQAIGRTNDTNNAKSVGVTIGTYIKKYGFNMDFAPVADTNTNPKNVVIGDRSFGSEPKLVSRMVSAEINGFHSVNMICCLKHFPGHGDTVGDTHDGYVRVNKTWSQLKSCDLIPFINNLKKTDLVMVAHINVPKITDDGLPSSLSKEMITNRLRGELDYNGVVITDSLSMGAITDDYTSSESAVKAFSAGADIMLMPNDYITAFNGIYNAVQNGKISKSRLNQSVLRIIKLKLKYGIIK